MKEEKVLIIGGAFQGKLEFAKRQYNIEEKEILRTFQDLQTSLAEPAERYVIYGLHRIVQEAVSQEKGMEMLLESVKQLDTKNWIVISNETGYGIVPMKKEERYLREETGRLLCKAAALAEEVFRVVCGIPTQIK